jgi:uncharacterized protein with von Willebrand factor type A (vWA) domain
MPRNRHGIGGDGPQEGRDSRREDELRRIEESFGVSGTAADRATVFGVTPPAGALPTRNLRCDRYDARLYSELLAASSGLSELCSREDAPETFAALVNDLFLSYFKAQPDLLPEDGVRPAYRRANRPFIKRLLDDLDTYKARAATRLDAAASGLAALACGEKLIEEITNRPALREYLEQAIREEAPEEEPNDEPADGKEVLGSQPATGEEDSPDEDDRTSNQTRDGAEPEATGSPDEDEAPDLEGHGSIVDDEGLDDEYSSVQCEATSGADPPGSDEPELPGRDARRAMRSASRAAGEEASRIGGALAGWGFSSADLARVPLGERLDLLKRLSGPEMLSLSELVGRMRNLARQTAREQVRDRSDEIHSIETSSDLSRLLPTELSALAADAPELRLAAEARLIEGRAASWRLTPRKKQKRGPVVALCDVSFSMEGYPLQWATAVALGVVDLAAGRNGLPKRASAVLHFNTDVVSEIRFSPGDSDAGKLLALATVGASGGTAYEPVVKRALEIASESEYEGADILLITDALCRLDDSFVERILAEKERRGLRLYSVLIGASSNGELERYSERVWALSDLAGAGEGAAGELFSLF